MCLWQSLPWPSCSHDGCGHWPGLHISGHWPGRGSMDAFHHPAVPLPQKKGAAVSHSLWKLHGMGWISCSKRVMLPNPLPLLTDVKQQSS